MILKEKKIRPNDKNVIEYMIQTKLDGLYIPNPSNDQKSEMDYLHLIFDVAKPKTLEDIRIILCLINGTFSDRQLLIEQIKEYGIRRMICSKDQLYTVFCNRYDFGKEVVDQIINNLNCKNQLNETDELVLELSEVPESIISQLRNIKQLKYAGQFVVMAEFMYRLAFLKKYSLKINENI